MFQSKCLFPVKKQETAVFLLFAASTCSGFKMFESKKRSNKPGMKRSPWKSKTIRIIVPNFGMIKIPY